MKFGDTEMIEDPQEQERIFNIIQSFMCYLYNVGNFIDVDAARLQMFIDSYSVSDVNEAFNKKNYGISMLVAYHLAKVSYYNNFAIELYM